MADAPAHPVPGTSPAGGSGGVPPRPRSRRHRRRREQVQAALRAAFVVLLALVLLPALPWLAVALFVDVDTLRTQIEAAALESSGRALSLGRVTMLNSLPPTFAADDVTFANAPGASRAEMLRIPYAEATLGILPLLTGRLAITSLVLSRPDLVLEADPAGTGNWQFAAAPAGLLPGQGGHSARPRWARRHAAQQRAQLTLDLLRIREGRVAWRSDAGAWSTAEIRRLDASVPLTAEHATLTAQIVHADRTVSITLATGRLARLRETDASAPWPVALELETRGAHASIAGTLTRPLALRGYRLAVEGSAENLGDLQALLHRRLPPLRKLVFRADLADSGGAVPDLSGLAVRARESDLDSWVPGLRLAGLDLAAASFDRPVHAELDGIFDRQPLHLSASLGAPAALLSPGRAPGRLPVALEIAAAGGEFAVKGSIAAPERGTGLDLELSGTIPDLGALSPLVGFRLPAFRNIALGLHAGDAEGGFRQGIALRNIALRSADADLAGEADLPLSGRAPVRVVLTGRSLDLDALRAAMAPPAAPARPDAAGGWLIPADRLPLGALAGTELELRATVARLLLGGAQLHDAALLARLHDGQLTVDPLTVALPGGGIELKAALDLHGRFPPVTLALRALGVPARPVFALLGLPDDSTGTLTLLAGLRSAGASWHELASGLSGQFAAATTDAEIDNRLLHLVVSPALRVAGLNWPGAAGPGARTPARCAVLRIDARRGLAALRSFVLDTPSLLLQIDGALQLRDERIALRIRPTPHGGGLPANTVRIGGVFTATTIFPEQVAQEPPAAAGLATDVCAEALTLARAPMPVPPPP